MSAEYPRYAPRDIEAQNQRTVVIVDDEEPLVSLLCAVLEEEGFSAVGCTTGAEALNVIRLRMPDLIVLDVQIPGIDGVSIFHRLRAEEATSTVPIIFLTSAARALQRRLPDLDERDATVMSKPFGVVELLACVRQMLGM